MGKILPLSWLPNQKNFLFIGVKFDGTDVQCVIDQDDKGLHFIVGANFKELKGWEQK